MFKRILFLPLLLICNTALCDISLDLSEIEKKAYENNLLLLQSQEELGSAKEVYLASISMWLPQVSFIWKGEATQRERGSDDPKHYFANGLNLTQSVFSPDIYYGIKSQKLNVDSSELSLQDLQSTTLFLARQSYFQSLLSRNELDNFENNVKLFAEIVRQEKEKYDVGSTTEYELHQQRVSLAEALSQLDNAKKDYLNNIETLKYALSFDEDIDPQFPKGDLNAEALLFKYLLQNNNSKSSIEKRIKDLENLIANGVVQDLSLDQSLFSADDIDYWVKQASEKQPSLMQQQLAVEQAGVLLKQAKGDYFPTVSFQADYGTAKQSPTVSSPLSTRFFPDKYYASGLISLNWDIFNSFETARNVSSQKYQYQAAKYKYKDAMLNLKVEVRSQLQDIEAAFYNYLSSKKAVDLAKLAVKQAFIQREVGTISGLDLRVSIQKLSDVTTTKNNASYKLIISYYTLLELIGDITFSDSSELKDVF